MATKRKPSRPSRAVDFRAECDRASTLCARAAELRRLSRALCTELQDTSSKGKGARRTRALPRRDAWGSFVLAMNWVALAVLDVERHHLAGSLGWYEARRRNGIGPRELASDAPRIRVAQ